MFTATESLSLGVSWSHLVSSTPEKVKGMPSLSKTACSSPLSPSLPIVMINTTSGFTLFFFTTLVNFSWRIKHF